MHDCILTLVERKTGNAIVKKFKARTSLEVTYVASRAIRSHCRNFKTITFGTHFHHYARLEQRFPLKVYCATPNYSWSAAPTKTSTACYASICPKEPSWAPSFIGSGCPQ